MATELLDILDTAVKIGLGAIATGITAYYINKSNHRSDIGKELRENKFIILQDISTLVAEYFNALDSLIGHVDGAISSGFSDTDWKVYINDHFKEGSPSGFIEADNRMLSAVESKSSAITKMYLLGLDDMAKEVELLDKYEDPFRDEVLIKEILITKDELDKLVLNLSTMKRLFYKSLKDECIKIYK